MLSHWKSRFLIVGLCLVGLYYAKADIFDLGTSGHNAKYIDPHAFEYQEERYYEEGQSHTAMAKATQFEKASKKMSSHGETPGTCAHDLKLCRMSLLHRPSINDIADELMTRRLVNIMLSRAGFKSEDGKEIGFLEIRASKAQLTELKKFTEGHLSLRQVDPILAKVLIQPSGDPENGRTLFFYHILNWAYHVFQQFLIFVSEYKYIIGSLFATVFMVNTLRRMRYNVTIVLVLVAFAIFSFSFLLSWWKLVQEAHVKHATLQMQYINMPASCRPDTMSLWETMKSFFSPADCEKYFAARMKNYFLEVTPAQALSHMLTHTVYEPIVIFGKILNGFVTNATDGMMFPLSWIVTVFIYVTFFPFLAVCFILLMGGSLNFGLWPFSMFSIRGPNNRLLESKEERRPIEVIRNTISEQPKAEESRVDPSAVIANEAANPEKSPKKSKKLEKIDGQNVVVEDGDVDDACAVDEHPKCEKKPIADKTIDRKPSQHLGGGDHAP